MHYSIVILEVFDPWANMPDRQQYAFDFEENGSQAELRALRWLEGRPNDIVMLVTTHFCKHCTQRVHEVTESHGKRWYHEDGTWRHNRNPFAAAPRDPE